MSFGITKHQEQEHQYIKYGCVRAVSAGTGMGKHSGSLRANVTPRHTTQGREC